MKTAEGEMRCDIATPGRRRPQPLRLDYGPSTRTGTQVANYGQSWMQTSAEGEGTLTFYWKVSSESGFDYLEFYIDDNLQTGRISGEQGWSQKSYEITGTWTHTFKWRYMKDGGDSEGDDCGWVDFIQWTPEEVEPPPEPDPWTTITYSYDPAGRRIAKSYDGQTVAKSLYDGGHILADYDGNGTLLHKYIYGPDTPAKSEAPSTKSETSSKHQSAMIEMRPPARWTVWDFGRQSLGHVSSFDIRISDLSPCYYHYDGLGSVVALSDEAGDTVEVYEYSIFGQVAASDPNHPNRFLFTGREFDSETGLYYYRARYYNPYIGRFLQTDPADDGTNPYTYCGNNALNAVDPSGLLTSSDRAAVMQNPANLVEVIWLYQGWTGGSPVVLVNGAESIAAIMTFFGVSFVNNWIEAQQAAQLVRPQLMQYIAQTERLETISRVCKNPALWEPFGLSHTLAMIMADRDAKTRFFRHHFPLSHRYDIIDAERIFLEAWVWSGGLKPPVEDHSGDNPNDKWGPHLHAIWREVRGGAIHRGEHIPITYAAYRYLRWLYYGDLI
jgi:RHS repeat-associated protein